MLGKEGLGEVHKVRDSTVVAVCPERSELKAVGGFLAAIPMVTLALLDVAEPGSVGVVFGVGTVGDHEDLDILIESGTGPEAVPLIAVDLVECLFQGYAPAFQFYMDQRQTIDQNVHIIAVVLLGPVSLSHLILVDDL